MSTNLEYLLQLHRNGVITDDDLRKGIRILKDLYRQKHRRKHRHHQRRKYRQFKQKINAPNVIKRRKKSG